MSTQEHNISTSVDHLFRHESGKMVAVLSRLLGMQQLETAQDLVQDTLLQAMNTWGYNGLPENPAAWLMKVAKNKAIDHLRRQRRFNEISPAYAYLLQSEYTFHPTINTLFLENEITDSQLRMIFACCHPAIPPESQIALTLKTLCGLNVREIANAFLTGEDTIAKRIYRAREKIKAEKIELEAPAGNELAMRVDAVLKTLYLLFNEGYNSSHPEQLIREDLCREAMRLCLLLTEQKQTDLPRTRALLSLMCFQASRLTARLDDKGNIVLLKYQDRNLWYRPLIQKGFDYLDSAAEPFEESPYHLEAAIASLHAAAPSFEATNWQMLLRLYDLLLKMTPSPVIELNRCIVLSMVKGPKAAIVSIHEMPDIQSLIGKHYLFAATLGELHSQLAQCDEACYYFEKAIGLTPSPLEKALLKKKIRDCSPQM